MAREQFINYLIINVLLKLVYCSILEEFEPDDKSKKSIQDLESEYEDEINSLLAFNDNMVLDQYDSYYEDMDDRVYEDYSMNVILFGPSKWFMRMDTETVIGVLNNVDVNKVPIPKIILAWDIITDGKTAAYLQGRDFQAFGRRLNVVPEEDLYYTNFGDLSVIQYFGKHDIRLQSRKLGVLVSAYKRYYGHIWHSNATYIDELGYLLCGFPSYELQKITPRILKDVSVDSFNKLQICTTNQSQTIFNIAVHPDAFGKPYKWLPHEISRLGWLITCIPSVDISYLQLESIAAISDNLMKLMDVSKLRYFTHTQIMRMNPAARRTFILRMQRPHGAEDVINDS